MVEEKIGEIKILSDVSLLGDWVDSDSINGDGEHKKVPGYLGGWGGREKEMKSALDMFSLSCPRNNSYADVQHVIEYSDSLDNCSANIHSYCGQNILLCPTDVGTYVGEPGASKALKYTCSVGLMFVSFR